MTINNWQIKKIKEIVNFNELNIVSNDEFQEIEYIDITSVNEGKIIEKKIMKFNDSPSRAKRILRNNDIIISTVRPNMRHYAFIKDAKKNTICSTGFVVLTPKKIEPRFLYYFLTQESFTEFLSQIAESHTSTYPAFNPKIIENANILLPEHSEQKIIGKVLGTIDDKIELNNQINQTLEKIAQSLFKHWFIDFEFPDENNHNLPYKSSGGEMVNSELGKIPKGWDIARIRDLGDIICGKTPSKSSKEFFGGKILFIKIPDMHNNTFIIKSGDSLTEEGKKNQTNKTLQPYSILVSCIATIGLVSITSEYSQTNQQINAIIPRNLCYTYFLYCKLKLLRGFLTKLGSCGSATLNVNTKQFSEIKISKPKDIILNEFDKIVFPLFKEILQNQKESQTLIQIRDSLLPKLMTGKIRVNIEDESSEDISNA